MDKIKEEVSKIYKVYDEDQRLMSQAGRIEFYTSIHNIEKHLKPGMTILDIGAGTGAYSLYFASKGYKVTALELVESHVQQIRDKATEDMDIHVHQGNALDLSLVEGQDFDVVLCFGPLYHLFAYEERQKVIKNIKKCCHHTSMVYYAFIANDMIPATESLAHNTDFLLGSSYDKATFVVNNDPFVFHKLDDCRTLLQSCGVKILKEIASDGLSELLADKINAMDAETYDAWLKYHIYCSDKPEFLGATNHFLMVGQF